MQCDVWMSRILLVTVMWQGNGNKTQPNGVKFNCAVASKNSRNHRCLYHHHSPIGCSMLLLYWSSNWWKNRNTDIYGNRALQACQECVFCILCMPVCLNTVILCHAEQPNHFQYHNSMRLVQLVQHAETWCNMVPGLSLPPRSLFGDHLDPEGANLFETLFETATCIGSAQESV